MVPSPGGSVQVTLTGTAGGYRLRVPAGLGILCLVSGVFQVCCRCVFTVFQMVMLAVTPPLPPLLMETAIVIASYPHLALSFPALTLHDYFPPDC